MHGNMREHRAQKNKKGCNALLAALNLHHNYDVVRPKNWEQSKPKEPELEDDVVIDRDSVNLAEIRRQVAQEAMRILKSETAKYLRVADIKKAVAIYFGLEVIDLDSATRTRVLTTPRHIAMYLCRTMTVRSFPEIAKMFGGRDHTTVLHGYHRIRTATRSDFNIAYDVAHLEAIIGMEPAE